FRVYEDGKPAATPDYFRWSRAGANEGDLIFMSGNPAKTNRLLTVAQLRYQRDVVIPDWGLRLAEHRGMLAAFRQRGAEQARIATGKLFTVENNFKRAKGQARVLADPAFMAAREAAEKDLRARVASDPRFAPAWDDIERATNDFLVIRTELREIEDS